MQDKDQKIVNTQEQNRAVNPIGMDSQDNESPNEPFLNNAVNTSGGANSDAEAAAETPAVDTD